MANPAARIAEVITTTDETVHIRCDAPGERAVSAPIGDPISFIRNVALAAGLEVDDSTDGELYISFPPGS